MYQKLLSFIFITFLLQMICITSVSAQQPTDTETQRIVKLKERISVIHLENKRVVITRRDGTKLKGRISEVKESSFIVRDVQTGATSEVKYDDAAKVKTKGNALSTGAKILIGVGIAAAVVVVLFIVKPLAPDTSFP